VASIIAAAVRGAGPEVPVTVKMRVGLTEALKTHLQTARIAQAEGAAAVTLHARTADQQYSPPPDWGAIQVGPNRP
jgi:tRNA-dihydrouridine synthase